MVDHVHKVWHTYILNPTYVRIWVILINDDHSLFCTRWHTEDFMKHSAAPVFKAIGARFVNASVSCCFFFFLVRLRVNLNLSPVFL